MLRQSAVLSGRSTSWQINHKPLKRFKIKWHAEKWGDMKKHETHQSHVNWYFAEVSGVVNSHMWQIVANHVKSRNCMTSWLKKQDRCCCWFCCWCSYCWGCWCCWGCWSHKRMFTRWVTKSCFHWSLIRTWGVLSPLLSDSRKGISCLSKRSMLPKTDLMYSLR